MPAQVESEDGEIYVYELTLKVDSSVDVFNTDEIILRTSGLLGERNVEIAPHPLEAGEKLKKVENKVLYAAQTGSVENTLKQFGNLSQKFDIFLEDLNDSMKEIKKREIISKIADSMQNIKEMTDALNQPDKYKKTIDNVLSLTERANRGCATLDQTLENFYQLSNRVQNSWTTVDLTLEEVYATASSARTFVEKANQIIDYTCQGKGTIGQLFIGEDLFLRLKSILHKGETVMNDITSYGILFQSDKRWQRLQAGRLRLLEKLSKPCEFARYFNQEMDEISASILRVSLILNESDCYPQSLIYNPDFTKKFADLLRRVENMEDSLKMYNEQIIDQEDQE